MLGFNSEQKIITYSFSSSFPLRYKNLIFIHVYLLYILHIFTIYFILSLSFFSISIYLPNTLFHLHPPQPQITTLFTIFELVKKKKSCKPSLPENVYHYFIAKSHTYSIYTEWPGEVFKYQTYNIETLYEKS